MRLTKFGTITLPELNGRDNGIGSQGRSNIIPLRDGGYDLDGSSVFLEPMTISRSAVLTENIDSTIDNLFGEMRKGRMVLQAQMRDSSLRHTFAKMSLQMRDISADKYLCEQPINLQWIANYPYWISTVMDFDYFDNTTLVFDGTDSFDGVNFANNSLDSGDISDIIVVTNSSKFNIYRVFFNFEVSADCNSGNIRVVNNTNGSEFIWHSTLETTGDKKRLDIDCLSKFAFSSNSTNEYENMEIVGNNELDWFFLSPGNNNLTFEALDITDDGIGQLDYRIIWATHYL